MDQRPGILAAAFALAAAAALLPGCQAPQPAGEDEADGAQPAAAWSPEADCGSCHVKEGSSFQSTATALAHAASSCLDCHTNATALESAHAEATEGAETPSKLSSNARISPDTCLGCHDQTETQEDLARSAILVDEEGTEVNPHDLPEGHLGERISCTDCHLVHEDADTDQTAQAACTTCHHENVYQCGTCHER